MTYRTLACIMAFICGLVIPAGAATSADGLFDQPILQPAVGEKLASTMVTLRLTTRNVAGETGVLDSGTLAATTAQSKGGSIVVVDNALLVSVHGNAMVNSGPGSGMVNETTYNKATVAFLKDSFNNSTGVANINVAAGNLNTQSVYFSYSGPDLLSNGLTAASGSAKPGATRK
jgi:hypothetical protein